MRRAGCFSADPLGVTSPSTVSTGTGGCAVSLTDTAPVRPWLGDLCIAGTTQLLGRLAQENVSARFINAAAVEESRREDAYGISSATCAGDRSYTENESAFRDLRDPQPTVLRQIGLTTTTTKNNSGTIFSVSYRRALTQ